MASFAGNVMLLPLALLFTLTICASGHYSLFPTIHVRVINKLSNSLTLTVHCKSADDDIGVKVLAPDGFFEFKFRSHVVKSTQFYCSFQWPDVLKWFDVYTQERDMNKCTKCYWSITQDKPCRLNEKSGLYDNCFEWNKPKYIVS
ncbi:hypothetical protein EV1_032351 [Malus domestica]